MAESNWGWIRARNPEAGYEGRDCSILGRQGWDRLGSFWSRKEEVTLRPCYDSTGALVLRTHRVRHGKVVAESKQVKALVWNGTEMVTVLTG